MIHSDLDLLDFIASPHPEDDAGAITTSIIHVEPNEGATEPAEEQPIGADDAAPSAEEDIDSSRKPIDDVYRRIDDFLHA
jgi:hypothetical protein